MSYLLHDSSHVGNLTCHYLCGPAVARSKSYAIVIKTYELVVKDFQQCPKFMIFFKRVSPFRTKSRFCQTVQTFISHQIFHGWERICVPQRQTRAWLGAQHLYSAEVGIGQVSFPLCFYSPGGYHIIDGQTDEVQSLTIVKIWFSTLASTTPPLFVCK